VLGTLRAHLKNLHASGLISFKYAWTYFPKDSIIYSPGKDCEKLCKVTNTEFVKDQNGRMYLRVNAQEIVFDGETFEWQDVKLDIKQFEGNRPIIELDHYPLSSHPDPVSVRKSLAARGERVLEYQGLSYCEYAGLGIFEDDTGCEKHNVTGRILIDIFGYKKHHLSLSRNSGKDAKAKKNKKVKKPLPAQAELDAVMLANMGLPPPPPPAQSSDVKVIEKDDFYIKRLTGEEQKKNRDEMMSKERKGDLIFLSPMLMGFALKNKLWCKSTFSYS
jgi:hypothetical protein